MKKYAFFVLAMLCPLLSFSQADSSRQDLAALFSNLNKSLIPNGYLSVWGTDMADKDDYNGIITDSNTVNDMDMLRMLYADIYSSRISPTALLMPDLENLNNSIDNAVGNPVVILFARYGEFKPDALQQGFLTYRRGMLYDALPLETAKLNLFNSAYIQKTLFCAYPAQNIFTNAVAIKYDPNLFYTNTGSTIQSVQADFGSGYENMLANTMVSHTYTDSSGLHIIKLKAVLDNGQVCETQMVVNVRITGNNNVASRYTVANLDLPDINLPPVPGVHSGCKVYIRKSVQTASLGKTILKPFIVVEGFDIHDAAPQLGDNYNINKFIDEIDNKFVENTNNRFSTQLDDIGQYDLVFIDWNNGADDIVRNATALEQVISQINAMKATNGSAEQNVVMGVSMGGLITRYCLASMTKRNLPTGTRLLLTMDSPHQGAYVPLAFQHLVRGLQDVRILSIIRLGSVFHHSIDQANSLLNSPGAQQQLLITATDANGNVAGNTFLNNIYRPMITFGPNDPQPSYVFKAVSDGSQCGIGSMTPGANLVSGAATANLTSLGITLDILIGLPVITKLKFKTSIQANALTGNYFHQILDFKLQKQIQLFGIFNATKTYANLQRIEPNFNTVPWESVPGGYESLGQRLGTGSNTLQNNWSLIGQWFLGYNVSFTLAPVFGFVPVTSSLDVQYPSSYYNQYIYPVNGLNGSLADKYIAQEKLPGTSYNNNHHTDFTSRNARWIYNEMENLPQPSLNCGDVCIDNTSISITGPSAVCVSENYAISGLPASGSVAWTVSPVGLATLSNQSAQSVAITAAPGVSGNAVLTANADFCGTIKSITLPVHVGSYQSSDYTLSGNSGSNYWCPNQQISFGVSGTTATSFNWNVPIGWSMVYNGGSYAVIKAPPISTPQTGTLSVTFTEPCGSSVTLNKFLAYGGGCAVPSPYSISPNPAASYITIACTSLQNYCNIAAVQITDLSGFIYTNQSWPYTNQSVQIPVYSLTNGIYVARIYDGSQWFAMQFVVQH